MPEVDQILGEGNERGGVFRKQDIVLLWGIVNAPHLALLLQPLEQQRRAVSEVNKKKKRRRKKKKRKKNSRTRRRRRRRAVSEDASQRRGHVTDCRRWESSLSTVCSPLLLL